MLVFPAQRGAPLTCSLCLERTTGFEPATPTLAKKSECLIRISNSHQWL